MKPRSTFAISRAMAMLLILTMASGCNMMAQKGQGKSRRDSQYASQSQALSGAGSLPAGYGSSRLEYKHHFTFNYGGSNSVTMEVTVQGMVPIQPTFTDFVQYQCGDGTVTARVPGTVWQWNRSLPGIRGDHIW